MPHRQPAQCPFPPSPLPSDTPLANSTGFSNPENLTCSAGPFSPTRTTRLELHEPEDSILILVMVLLSVSSGPQLPSVPRPPPTSTQYTLLPRHCSSPHSDLLRGCNMRRQHSRSLQRNLTREKSVLPSYLGRSDIDYSDTG